MHGIGSIILCGACFLLLGYFSQAHTADNSILDELTSEEILDRMVEAYSSCKTYQDSGVVKTIFIQNGGERVVEKRFTTAFVRPDRFRFE
jgi:outer membrane lipoprotein-sorting protein